MGPSAEGYKAEAPIMMRPEQEIQKAIVKHLRQRGAPGLVFWHTPNGAHLGGKRNRKGFVIQRGILAGMGARAGVSDLVFLRNRQFYCLEIKAPGQVPTEEQLEFIDDVKDAGGFGAWCQGLDRALSILERWGILRGKAAAA